MRSPVFLLPLPALCSFPAKAVELVSAGRGSYARAYSSWGKQRRVRFCDGAKLDLEPRSWGIVQ